jgi:Immunity protein 50
MHDAEITRLVIDPHGPTVELLVRPDAQLADGSEYTLRFIGVTELELNDLYTQNVLFDLQVEQTDDGGWRVALNPSVGIGGVLRCATVEHEPVRGHS